MSGTTEPVLADDLDPVLLIRLYPEADGIAAAGGLALEQGAATAEAGALLEASQHEPVLGAEMVGEAVTPPVNVDVPAVGQVGSTLECTMGNWTGEPTSYSYAWQINGNAAGTDNALYVVQAGDVGGTATCTVTASNAAGSTTAPPSNEVVVV